MKAARDSCASHEGEAACRGKVAGEPDLLALQAREVRFIFGGELRNVPWASAALMPA